MALAPYLRTASHLTLSQLAWRLRYAWERRWKASAKALSRWRWRGQFPPSLAQPFPMPPCWHEPPDRLAEEGKLQLLNQVQEIGHDNPDWRLGPVSTARLWTITLHYHAWIYNLARQDAALSGHYLADWISRCALDAPGARDLAWNAYAIATRLTWWIRSYPLLGAAGWSDWDRFEPVFLASLWEQAAYLRDHLEWDLRANHLMRDAVGLAWAGRFFAEERAREWLQTATRLAVEQAEEQVLADGGHFERSPSYHLHVMEDLLSLALLLEDDGARQRLRETWQRMAEFLAWLRHPDGDLALFNDGGLRGAPVVEAMLHAGERLGVSVDSSPRRGGAFFPQTGLAVWHGDPWSVFFDVGAVGPDYQPGHAHADTLSVECSFRGRRLFVDPGTYAYDRDERRRYDRSTAAHNTVCIDGQDSSEVWHIFRVGRRAYPCAVDVAVSTTGMRAAGAHTGYDHLPGRPRHARRLEVGSDGKLLLGDRVTGSGQHQVEGGFLLAPEWSVTPAEEGWLLRSGADGVRLTVRGPQGTKLSEQRRAYHPDYGREIECTRLSWRLESGLPVEVVTLAEGV